MHKTFMGVQLRAACVRTCGLTQVALSRTGPTTSYLNQIDRDSAR